MSYKFYPVLFSLLVLHSCQDNKNELLRKSIVGKWSVYASEINNKPNGLMQDAFFDFRDDKSVFSNLFDENNEHFYTVENGRLAIDIPEKFDMKLVVPNKDTIIMEGKMKVFYMKFYLTRTN